MDYLTLILGISISLQFAAAFFALRLIKITGRPIAWSLLSSAIFLMAIRRCVTFFSVISGELSRPPDLIAESIALIISALMLAGIFYIGPLFLSIKRSENSLRIANRAYKVLSNCNQAVVHSAEESKLLHEICRIIVEDGGYRLAWIGFAEQDKAKTVRPIAQMGFEEGYLETVNIIWADAKRGKGPTGTAIRTGKPSVAQNILTDPAFEPWRDQAIKRGYASAIALPLFDNSHSFGALNVYAAEPDAFAAEEVNLLTELAGDLTYGIMTLRTRDHHQRAEEALKESQRYTRGLIEYSLDPLVMISAKGKITDLNSAMEQITGISRKEIIGTGFSNYFADPDAAKKIYQQVFRDGYVRDYPLETKHRDGKTTSVLYNASVYKDGEGNVAGVFAAARDITERKQAEDAIRESKNKLQVLYDSSSDAIMLLDEKGFFDCNNATLRLFGCSTKEEFCGRHPADFSPPTQPDGTDSMRYAKNNIAFALKKGNKRFEHLHRRLDSTDFPADVLLDALMLGGKKVLQARVFDITGRKRAEEQIRLANERLQYLIFSSAAVIYTAKPSPDYEITFISENILQMTGYLSNVFLDNSGFWFEQIHPEDRQRILNELPRIFEQEVYTLEYRLRRKDGTYIWVHDDKKLVLDMENKPLEIISYALDITSRKQAEEALQKSEEKYRKFFEEDLTGDYISAPDGRLLFCNPAFIKIFGFESIEEAMNCNMNSLYPDKEAREAFLKELKIKKKLKLNEVELRNCRGKPIYVIQNVIGNFNQNDDLVAIQGYLLDLTEKKKLEEQLLGAQKMEAVGKLAGGVAHDFNNLLTVINGYSEIILTQSLDKESARKHIEQIKKAGERAASLTTQLLIFSRRQIIQPKIINLNSVVSDVEKILRRLIGEDIELVTMLDKESGNIKADPSQIDQVIMNLAVNARDAMPKGGKLIIETKKVYLDKDYAKRHLSVKPGAYIMLAISDTGVGMDAETKSKIFEPFFTTKERGKGTGLGLSTVYGIVKQSGGNIWVYSEPGKGTTFKIYLARIEEETDKEVKAKPSPESLKGSETILLVEDDHGVRKLARDILTNYGYNVLDAENGDRAISICNQYKKAINLMITDVVMPKMSGRELEKKITPLYPEIKVLFVSGYTDNAIVHHGVLDSDVAFLAKPFSTDALVHKVREMLDTS